MQIRDCLRHIGSLTTTLIRKRDDRFEASSSRSYPPVAVREALVNAVYHRRYEADSPEPTKVYLYPDRIEITSYHPDLCLESRPGTFGPMSPPPPAPARNRRIGEFLKELELAEGRLTGVGKIFAAMARNGSPPPSFDFDRSRSYFRVTHADPPAPSWPGPWCRPGRRAQGADHPPRRREEPPAPALSARGALPIHDDCGAVPPSPPFS